MTGRRRAEHPEIVAEVGRRMRAMRKRRGMTLEKVEAVTGRVITAVAMAAWERGDRQPSIVALCLVADALQVSPAVLLPGVPMVDPVQVSALTQAMHATADRLTEALRLVGDVQIAAVETAP